MQSRIDDRGASFKTRINLRRQPVAPHGSKKRPPKMPVNGRRHPERRPTSTPVRQVLRGAFDELKVMDRERNAGVIADTRRAHLRRQLNLIRQSRHNLGHTIWRPVVNLHSTPPRKEVRASTGSRSHLSNFGEISSPVSPVSSRQTPIGSVAPSPAKPGRQICGPPFRPAPPLSSLPTIAQSEAFRGEMLILTSNGEAGSGGEPRNPRSWMQLARSGFRRRAGTRGEQRRTEANAMGKDFS